MHRQIKFKIVSIVSIVFKTNAKEPAQNVSSSKQNSAAFLKQNIVVFFRQNLIAFLRRNIVVFSKQKLCCLLTKKILLSFLSCVFLPVFLLFYLSFFSPILTIFECAKRIVKPICKPNKRYIRFLSRELLNRLPRSDLQF